MCIPSQCMPCRTSVGADEAQGWARYSTSPTSARRRRRASWLRSLSPPRDSAGLTSRARAFQTVLECSARAAVPQRLGVAVEVPHDHLHLSACSTLPHAAGKVAEPLPTRLEVAGTPSRFPRARSSSDSDDGLSLVLVVVGSRSPARPRHLLPRRTQRPLSLARPSESAPRAAPPVELALAPPTVCHRRRRDARHPHRARLWLVDLFCHSRGGCKCGDGGADTAGGRRGARWRAQEGERVSRWGRGRQEGGRGRESTMCVSRFPGLRRSRRRFLQSWRQTRP